MADSLISRLLQMAVAAVFLGAFADVGHVGHVGHVGRVGRGGAGNDLLAVPEFARVTDIPSHEGRYVASLAPAGLAWDGTEGWTISLRDANGAVVEGAALAVEAWQPDAMDAAAERVAAEPLGMGQYRVDGIALDSSGWWNVKLAIDGAAADSLAFNVVLR